MKKKLSLLMTLLLCAVMGAWADTVVLGTPTGSVSTLSDANGIVTITDASGSTGIQQGSGSYKVTYDGTEYVPMKLSGSRNFTLSYKEGVTISKVTLMAMSNGDAEGTVDAGDGDATSLGTFPARNNAGNCLTVDITGKTGLRGSRQWLALIVVEYTEAPVTKTVTFVNDMNWAKVNVWAWNDEEGGEAFMGTSWPGVEITPVEGVYTWSTTKSPTKIIFNDGTNQTATFNFEDGATYNTSGKVVVLNDYTATLTTDMETVYAYVWSGEGDAVTNKALGDWPGTQLTATDGTYNVAFQAEEAPEHIIFHNNAGVQTADLDFVNEKAYEYNKQDFTVTFKTDADWENVYAWTWTGSDESLTNHEEPWPGKKLTAQNGVYTYTYNGYVAPENILFNGGDDNKKTADMKFVDGKAYKYITATPLFPIQAGETYKYGQTVEVKDAENEVVATITFGNKDEEGSDFNATSTNSLEGYTGYVAQTSGGNGTNGNKTGGTTYTIKPKYDGQLSIAVKVTGTKVFHLYEDGKAVAPHDGFKPEETFFGTIDFAVMAGKAYKFYCDGSKLDIFGFDYTFEKPAPDYYLVGTFNMDAEKKWLISDEYKLTKNEEADTEEYSITVDLPAWTQLKVLSTTNTWYPDGANFTINNDGNYTIFFRPKGDGGDGWYEGCIYAQNNGYVNMTITNAGYATFSSANDVAIPEGVTAYYAQKNEKKENTINLKPIEGGYIPANTGVVVVAGAAGTYKANVTDPVASLTGNLLQPWLTAGTPEETTYYTLAVEDGKPVFKKSAGGTLAAGKAYLVLSAATDAHTLDVVFGDATGISATLKDNGEMTNGQPVYNLAGQRVSKPTKGLYIVGGKKVALR